MSSCETFDKPESIFPYSLIQICYLPHFERIKSEITALLWAQRVLFSPFFVLLKTLE